MNKRAFLFPGQGSQQVGMGAELAGRYRAARRVFEEADRLLGFSLSRVCFQGPTEQLAATRYTQPAVFVASVAVLEVLREKGITCQAVAGHSLGEYAALVAAGVLSFPEALKIVQRRAELMEEAYPSGRGGMAAVLGLNRAKVAEICQEAGAQGEVWPANFNAPGQVVISGTREGLEAAARLALQAGAGRVITLPVSGPFHSPLMRAAEVGLAEYLKGFSFRQPEFPLLMNVTGDFVSQPDAIRACLVRQVTSPVRWEETMQRLGRDGFGDFLETGPGRVLTGLARRTVPGCRAFPVGDLPSLEKVLAQEERTD